MMNVLKNKRAQYIIPNDVVGRIQDGKKIPSKSAENGRDLHTKCRTHIDAAIAHKDEFYTACLWYILNKLSYSGMAMIGSYAPLAWDQNFTESCILKLPNTSTLLKSVKHVEITNLDYSELLGNTSEDTFLFLDPPYKIPHSLYGRNGDMHEAFDHQLFSDKIKKCKHKWMITYNQDPTIEKWFDSYNKIPWDLTYTMKAAKRNDEDKADIKIEYAEGEEPEKSGKKGKELLILNYTI